MDEAWKNSLSMRSITWCENNVHKLIFKEARWKRRGVLYVGERLIRFKKAPQVPRSIRLIYSFSQKAIYFRPQNPPSSYPSSIARGRKTTLYRKRRRKRSNVVRHRPDQTGLVKVFKKEYRSVAAAPRKNKCIQPKSFGWSKLNSNRSKEATKCWKKITFMNRKKPIQEINRIKFQ